MKKLFTLLLAIAGMVSTASATDYILTGDAAITNNSHRWYAVDNDNLMTETAEGSGIYTIIVENCSLVAGTTYNFRIKINEDSWNHQYPSSAAKTFKVGFTSTYTLIYFLNTNASNYVSVIGVPVLRSDLYNNWNNLDVTTDGYFFTKDNATTWHYDIPSTSFTNGSYYFRLFSAVGDRYGDHSDYIYSGKQIYPKTDNAELTYPETEESYYNDNKTGWSWKISKPGYDFEKVRITAAFDTSNETWEVSANAYISKKVLADNDYATFGTTVPVDLSVLPADVTAYTLTADASTGKITKTEKNNALAANEGVLLYNTNSTNAVLSIPVAASANASSSNDLVAFTGGSNKLDKVTVTGYTNYILANETAGVGFYMVNSGGNLMGANTAYLKVKDVAGGARSFFWFDEASGISNTVREATANDRYYNLNGQVVAQPTKGLYIVNGKKVIMK